MALPKLRRTILETNQYGERRTADGWIGPVQPWHMLLARWSVLGLIWLLAQPLMFWLWLEQLRGKDT